MVQKGTDIASHLVLLTHLEFVLFEVGMSGKRRKLVTSKAEKNSYFVGQIERE